MPEKAIKQGALQALMSPLSICILSESCGGGGASMVVVSVGRRGLCNETQQGKEAGVAGPINTSASLTPASLASQSLLLPPKGKTSPPPPSVSRPIFSLPCSSPPLPATPPHHSSPPLLPTTPPWLAVSLSLGGPSQLAALSIGAIPLLAAPFSPFLAPFLPLPDELSSGSVCRLCPLALYLV